MEQQHLRTIASNVLGISTASVPSQILYGTDNSKLARVITLRNAVHMIERMLRGEKILKTDMPWSQQYNGRFGAMVRELKRSGYLEGATN